MNGDLTKGPVMKTMLRFAVPMILGNLLQQCYNVADTLIVGRFLGPDALAAVGSAFTLMTFLTSILLGLCMGSGAVFSIRFGQKDIAGLKESIFTSFLMISVICLLLNIIAFMGIDPILRFMRVPGEIQGLMHDYLIVIFAGITAVFLYNYFACLLRAIGNSLVPLIFLAVSALLNIVLDLWFIAVLHWGVAGAAQATILAQYISGIGIGVYVFKKHLRPRTVPVSRPLPLRPVTWLHRERWPISWSCFKEIAGYSILTCIQQSIMNLGILMVQGLVNSFGVTVMAAFAVAVKIDAFAYMPVQDFGNAFSSFIAQNYGAGQKERIRAGFKGAVMAALIFCLIVSAAIWIFARPLMLLFIDLGENAIISEGIRYLHIEGAFYCGIGCLFLLYGLYRALGRPGMSVVLTILSLGTRVALAYGLSSISAIGVVGIWWSVPIGWFLADAVGLLYFKRHFRRIL